MRDIERMQKLAETASRFRLDQVREATRLAAPHAQLEKLSRIYRDPLRNIRTLEMAYGRNFLARDTGLSLYLERSSDIDRALRFHLPRELEEIAALAEKFARFVDPFPGVFASRSDWELSLASRMGALEQAWILRDDPSLSLTGFAHLSRLSDAIHVPEPYSAPVGQLVAEELGDGYCAEPEDTEDEREKAAMRSGLKPDLIAFLPAKYNAVAAGAGFTFHYDQMPAPKAEGLGDTKKHTTDHTATSSIRGRPR